MSGEDLKQWRMVKGYTQQQLGELMGYKGRTAELMVQHWEHDRRQISPKRYRRLAKLLDIPVELLVP